MKTLILTLVLFLVVKVYSENFSVNELLNEEWEDYKSKYLKTYKNDEEYSRRRIWEENVRYIQKHNIQYDLGKYQYFLGINQFADMSNEEFREKYLKPLKEKNKRKGIKFMAPLNLIQLPTTVNWVTKGYVTPVKNQGQCGSCWTFSTTGSVEGQYFRKTHYLISLSEQQLVDCSGSFGTQGCNGGWMDDAFDYIQAFGIESEKDYPYSAVSGNCKYNATKVVTKISGHVDIDSDNEESLAIAVATQGPVSVAIDASQQSFQFYKGGVYNEPDCSTTNLDHAVLVVGYGIDSSTNYWLVKNSWGTSWGMQGYIQMSKDENNQCGIASKASYPTI